MLTVETARPVSALVPAAAGVAGLAGREFADGVLSCIAAPDGSAEAAAGARSAVDEAEAERWVGFAKEPAGP